ncbi:MAG: hypothetical protein ISR58_03145 [Anaerolineales bacterium]|nr:hypothetical protein [Chloroflexota bacterium]MBL6980168.1 hypothetical protein [Anaerolineales bacterium]
MSTKPNWKIRLQNELEQAQTAREAGNEGKTRVCARRAAGIAIGEYLQRNNIPNSSSSAYNRLQFLASLPDSTPRTRQIAQHLMLRVNEEFKLPIDADLIAETRELVEILLDESH